MRKILFLFFITVVSTLFALGNGSNGLGKQGVESCSCADGEIQLSDIDGQERSLEDTIFMQNGSDTLCGAIFFDSGGPNGNYQNDEDYTYTFYPDKEGAYIVVDFSSFLLEGGVDFLYVYDGPNTEDSTLLRMLSGIDVPDPMTATNSEGALTFRFHSDSAVSYVGWEATISCREDWNLEAVSISGYPLAIADEESTFEVTVKNVGSGSVSGESYRVKLRDDLGNELGDTVGVDLPIGGEATINVDLNTSALGEIPISGYIDFPLDVYTLNNSTDPINIDIKDNMMFNQVGEDTTFPRKRVPFDFYYESSAVQSLYTSDQISLNEGIIQFLSFENNFNSNLSEGKPVQIWIGETSETDLTGGWIHPDSLTLVYDDSVSFPSGQNHVLVELQNMYHYSGENLVIYTYRPYDPEYYSPDDVFYSTKLEGTNCSRYYASDDSFDSDLSTVQGEQLDWIPNTNIIFRTLFHSIEGEVLAFDEPLDGVQVTAQGDQFSQSTLTNQLGQYNLTGLQPGEYDISFVKHGYEDTVITRFALESDTVIEPVSLDTLSRYSIEGTVLFQENGIEDVNVILEGYNTYTSTTNIDGTFVFDEIYGGGIEYALSVTLDGYIPFDTLITVEDTSIYDINIHLQKIIDSPVDLLVSQKGMDAIFSWNTGFFVDDVESHPDFAINNIGDFEMIDQDAGETFGIDRVTFPNEGYSGSFIVFNPSQTTPPLTEERYQPHQGEKYLACLASEGIANNDWLITPVVAPAYGMSFSFVAKSATETYGLERFTVAVAHSDTPNDFTVISEGDYLEAPTEWTEFAFDLSEYVGDSVRIAINCVSDGSYMFMLDELKLGYAGSSKDVSFDVYLDNILVDTSITANSYLFEDLEEGVYTAGVKAVSDMGESNMVDIDFEIIPSTKVNAIEEQYMNIYPNPSNGQFEINVDGAYNLSIYNAVGHAVYQDNISDRCQIDLSTLKPGIYFVKASGEGRIITKSIVIKK
ncbi:MAG: carboxypeptidase regulatory-like domain-containing protein [Salinivirgaceae bacterium]